MAMQLNKPEILITKRFPDEITGPLRELAHVHQWNEPYELMPREEVLKVIERMMGVINQAELKVDEDILIKGKNLKIIANVSLGVDNLNLDLMSKYGVWATNTPGFFDYPVAEYAIGGIIVILRRMLEGDRFVKEGKWRAFQPGFWDGEGLTDKTLGIVGMGSIGGSLARLASCMGMKVIYNNRSKSSTEYQWVPLQDLLSRADVISLNVPYSSETAEMIAEEQFSKMKPGVVFVNTSRGKVVNEGDLVRFLKNGHIGGAVLDVFSNEPHVPDELKRMPNVLLSPHLAGGTKSRRLESYRLAADNIIQVLKGHQPVNPLNKLSKLS
jgi:glyoxylate reductase